MIFAPDLAAKITLGEKTVTRRPVKFGAGDLPLPCTYRVGKVYAVQLGRGGTAVARIRIVDVTREQIRLPLSVSEARAEGFATPRGFEDKWRSLYGADGPRDVWRIEFEVAA